MKVTKSQLQQIIKEELDAVLRLRKEHRGIPCDKRTGEEKRECEKKAEQAKERSVENRKNRKALNLEDEEIKALSKGKPWGMKPPHKTRKNQIKPKDQVNPNLNINTNQLTEEPTCTSRKDGKGMNRYHDKDGKFSSKSNAKSSSVRNPSNEKCRYGGQAKESPWRWTRRTCGRQDPKDGTTKAKFRCYDGAKIREMLVHSELVDNSKDLYDVGEWLLIKQDAMDDLVHQIIMDVLEDLKDDLTSMSYSMNENNSQLVAKCQQAGLRTFPQFLEAFNNLMLASKGDLYKQDKK